MNQELEQYLRFFINYRQKNQPKQLASAEFAINNKIYLITKVSSFIANYKRELRMKIDIKRKEKMKKTTEFIKRIKKVQEEVEVLELKIVDSILFYFLFLVLFFFYFYFRDQELV